MRIIFMGSPEFALPTLRRLIESEHDLAGVVAQPDRPAGRRRALRPPPTKELAAGHDIPVLQPERVNAPESIAAIRALAPEAIIIAAYGQILKQALLDIPTRGSLNVHASLLPRHRGASPIAAAILAGDEGTGVSIIEVVLALDAGPVLAQSSVPIAPSDTSGTLSDSLAQIGSDLIMTVLPVWERDAIEPQPQDESLTTYAPQVRSEDAVIDWSQPAVAVWRCVRAYNPWPVATTTVSGEPLRLLEAWPLEDEPDLPAGAVLPIATDMGAPEGAGFAVRCGRGMLAVVRAQRAGKRALSGDELLRGWQALAGQRLPS